MLNRLKSLLAAPPAVQPPSEALSTALLLLELASADFSSDDVELARVRSLLQARFALDAAALDALLVEARGQGPQLGVAAPVRWYAEQQSSMPTASAR